MSALKARLEAAGIDTTTLRPMEGAPDPIQLLTTSGAEALPLWRRLRTAVPELGYWPLLLGTEEDLEMHGENLEDADEDTGTLELLEAAERIDPAAWLAQQGDAADSEPDEAWPTTLPPAAAPKDEEFTIPREILTSKPHPEVFVALVPTPRCWEAPAYLRFGNWNSCPAPEEHVALWQSWHERYGAELVGISHDVVEAYVERPPSNRPAAEALAREQYLYCDDIVSQGCGTIHRLAHLLVNRAVWYFWWD